MEVRSGRKVEHDLGDPRGGDQAAILAGRGDVDRGRAGEERASRGVAGEGFARADGGIAEVPRARLAMKDRRIGHGQADARAHEQREGDGGEPAGEARGDHGG